jgi:uncharacterized delta-60 repeat protein
MHVVEQLESRRLLSFGQVDPTFGTDGRVQTPEQHTPLVSDLVSVPGGKILAAGNNAIVRYSAAGVPDPSFGIGGVVSLSNVIVIGLAQNASGQIYALIRTGWNTVLRRYTGAGVLDTTFGSGGDVRVSSTRSFAPWAITMQSDGKVLIAGVVRGEMFFQSTPRVYRRNVDGTGDLTFGTGGVANFTFGTTSIFKPDTTESVAGISVMPDGQILVGGGSLVWSPPFDDPDTQESVAAVYGDTIFATARLTTTGTLDTSYGDAGIARSTYASGGWYALPATFAMKSDGSVVLTARPKLLAVGEFSPTGSVSFERTTGTSGIGAPIDSVALADGRVVVLARPRHDSGRGMQITAIDPAGEMGNIVWTHSTSGIDLNFSGAMALSADGKILYGGTFSPNMSIEVGKLDSGNADDPRPDDFIGGENNSIAEDSTGGLHLAYYDALAKNLKYAYRDPQGIWSPTVVVDAAPYSGQYVSIALRADNIPAIAYYCGSTGDLKYASTTNRVAWSTQTVESAGTVGLYASLRFSARGEPGIAYYNKTLGDLRFALYDETAWQFRTIDSKGDVGRSCSLAIDPASNHFRAAYVDSSTGEVRYASRTKSGKWVVETVTQPGRPDFVSIASDPYTTSVSYYDSLHGDLHLASKLSVSASWEDQTIASKGDVGLYSSVVTQPLESAEIFAYNQTLDTVGMYIVGWKQDIIATGGGRFLSAARGVVESNIAYVDTALHALVVRPGTNAG